MQGLQLIQTSGEALSIAAFRWQQAQVRRLQLLLVDGASTLPAQMGACLACRKRPVKGAHP